MTNKNVKQLIREDFNNLKNTVKNSGYELVLQEKDNLLYIRLNNGIKHEIKYLRNTKEIRTAFEGYIAYYGKSKISIFLLSTEGGLQK